jgi:hypothetical protein
MTMIYRYAAWALIAGLAVGLALISLLGALAPPDFRGG